ncbi:uncharacterized protein LOC126725756 isoform X1 [Quercus robur]|uniref:uncharacterized protein LOC126725756 isoform X1 n=1 Tax=Quercus robur TaxID=38942 RepID=UPI002163F7A9|nr:uncharacterized protein LOC126725756 isoform X1 [Quercus robur]XP_050286617.1 uncharacterized protein LOC126725756 isoform X1 [Quercus robur]
MGSSLFRKLLLDDSDEDEIIEEVVMDSTSRKRRSYIRRNHLAGHERLYLDYFADSPVYSEKVFRRRFRMSRTLFLNIISKVEAHDPYFVQKRNGGKKLGLSSFQKITAALRMLAYGVTGDFMDEYVRIGETTALQSLEKFVTAVGDIFSEEYLRKPNNEDIARLLAHGKRRGFPGMLGSIDCMHWKWKNCPCAWKGQYCGHIREPTIILEAVASYDLWIWHAFFGLPGSNNDINVLERSPVFSELAQGRAPPVNYSINGNNYNMGYYLADGIYPKWATFVKTIPAPQEEKKKLFAKAQEAYRKDVERAFGVLQARFAIVRGPARFFYPEMLQKIMKACIILHNMIVEDERDENEVVDFDYEQIDEVNNPPIQVSREHANGFMAFIQSHQRIRDQEIHYQLQSDLINHLWQLHGES